MEYDIWPKDNLEGLTPEKWVKLINDGSLKITYPLKQDFEDFSIQYFLDKLKIKEEVISIRTGRGGFNRIALMQPEYIERTILDPLLDPLVSEVTVNPFIHGFRLSSFTYLVNTPTKLIKIIPWIKINLVD